MADDFKALLDEQKRTNDLLITDEQRAKENAAKEEKNKARSEAAREGWEKRREGGEKKQGGWLRNLGEKFVPAFLKKDKTSGSEDKEKKGKEGAFRKRFMGWMGKTSGFLSGMAKGAVEGIKSKLPSLKT